MSKAPQHIEDFCPRCGGRGRKVNGAWLRERREATKLTARSVARALGISVQYLCDIERNRRNPPADVVAHYETL